MSLDAYVHISHAPASGQPLIFAFHGTGGDETQLAALVRKLAPRAGVVSPRGDVYEGGAKRFFRRTGEGIYDMDDLAKRTDKMAGFVAAHKARHPQVPVLGVGYSNGANILASVVLQEAGLFDGVALMHPLIPWSPAANPGLAGKDVLITAGKRDPICPFPMTQDLAAYFTGQGAQVDLVPHPGGHEIRPEEFTALAGFLNRNAAASAR
ncbi:alpha/beta hydrolase [Mameliella alba]|nr:alpha/beta hydrolase [Mameliella alba]MBY6171569.1 alpha/beta hydrolase [Mameliella alba]MBY6176794.1 alpha/beta hydrolase [Mameliella alba]